MNKPNPKPITITLQHCGCPAGAWRATAPRHGISENHDDPQIAARNVITGLAMTGAFDVNAA